MPLIKLFQKTTPASDAHRFLAIVLVDGIAQTILWEVEDGKILLKTASERVAWNSEDTCLAAVDQGLQQLGSEAEKVQQTLFALSTDWVNAYGITAARKPLFQRLAKDLSLQPVGFVVITEALVQYLVETQGAAPNGFLVEVASTDMVVGMVKNGKLGQVERVGKSDNPISDVTEALARFHDAVLPSTFILFSTVLTDVELEEIRQQLFQHDWKSAYSFAQTPVIDLLPEPVLLEAVVLTGGRAYAESKKLLPVGAFHLEGQAGHENLKDGVDKELASVSSIPELGTQPSQDPATMKLDEGLSRPDTASAESLEPVLHRPPGMKSLWKFLSIGVVAGLLLLSVLTFAYAKTQMKADVLLTLDAKHLSKQVTMKLDPKASESSVENLVLKAQTLSKQTKGELSVATTGKKIIGDKAKGKVTIFNRTANAKSFTAGTVLANGKFQYTLNQDVTVASASTGTNFETNPGTVETDITAKEIGPESNLVKEKDLTIESFSTDTYVARSSTDIAGGSSREILAVSQVDRDKLLTELKQTLTQDVYVQMKSEAASGMFVVPTNQIKVNQASYSAELGKETNTVSLNLTLEAFALVYQKSDLQPFAEQLLAKDVPTSYTLDPGTVELLSSPQQASSSSAAINLDANISGKAKPQLDLDALKKQILGLSVTKANQTLRQQTGVLSVEITRMPSLLESINPDLPSDAAKLTVTATEGK